MLRQPFILGPCLGGHGLDGLELVAPDEVHVLQESLGLGLHDRVDLIAGPLHRTGGIRHQAGDIVEKLVVGLGHRLASAL
mgnify:CR=1 FL=1